VTLEELVDVLEAARAEAMCVSYEPRTTQMAAELIPDAVADDRAGTCHHDHERQVEDPRGCEDSAEDDQRLARDYEAEECRGLERGAEEDHQVGPAAETPDERGEEFDQRASGSDAKTRPHLELLLGEERAVGDPRDGAAVPAVDEGGLVGDEGAAALHAGVRALGEEAARGALEHALGREEHDLGASRAPGGRLGHSGRIVQEARATVCVMKYVPGDEWEARAPATLGLDPEGLAAAVEHHRACESAWPREFITPAGRYIGVADEPETSEVLGPVRPRGGPNGLILRAGHVAAEWGDTARVDMTFSVAKSYLAILAGLAVDRGLIRDVDDAVRGYTRDDGFETPQNREITWRHLLQQTSEWQGTLWDKPDSIDHNRDLGKSELGFARKGERRPMRPPGTLWEYNDVRVNRLALALLHVFREPLDEVLRREVMDPIGASAGWSWQPYRNAWVEIDGRRMPSVPGGSHWGGGLWMSTRDHARFGLLVQRGGQWGARRIVSSTWIDEIRRPCPLNPQYGLLWWLNTDRGHLPSAPASSFAARGAGSNVIWIDPEHDLVVVVRWIAKESVDGFVKLVVDSVRAA
jgi:hypothetical protein